MAGAIAQDRERCQFPFVLDEKPTVVSINSAGERSGGARKARLARIQSERAPSARVGKSSFKCSPIQFTGGTSLTLPQPCQNYMSLCETLSSGIGLMEIPTRLF